MKILLLFSFMLFTLACFAVEPDSLLQAAENNSDYIGQFDAYNRLSMLYSRKAPDKTDYYIDRMRAVANQHDNDSLLLRYYIRKAMYLRHHRNFPEATSYFYKAIDLVQQKEYYALYTDLCNSFGLMYRKVGNQDSAAYFIRESIKVAEKLATEAPDDMAGIKRAGRAHLNMGAVALDVSDYDLAIDEFYKALKYFEVVGDSVAIVSTHINLGVIYYYYKKYDLAKEQFLLGLHNGVVEKNLKKKASVLTNLAAILQEEGDYHQADSLYKEVLNIRLEIGPRRSLAGIYDNLGIIEGHLKNFDQALEYCQKALGLRQALGDRAGVISSYVNLGNLSMKAGKKALALNYYMKAKEIDTDRVSPEIKLELYRNMAQLYEQQGQWKKAYESYMLYNQLDDSIHSVESENTISELKEKYNASQKDQAILKFQKQQEIDKLVREKQKLRIRFLIAGIAFVLAAAAFIVTYINNKRKLEKSMYEKNREIQQQKMLDLVKQQEANSISSFIKGQEKERARIASDLHDRLGSLLSTVKLHFSSLEPELVSNKEIHENFIYAVSLLDKSVQEVRKVSHSLAKEILTDFGIIGAVGNLVDAINSAGSLKVSFNQIGYESVLAHESEIELYRMVQELVTNAIKHSRANELSIQFVMNKEELNITVEDDGVGFDRNKIQSEGMGLNNMKARAAKIKAIFTFDSQPGKGASFFIRVPFA